MLYTRALFLNARRYPRKPAVKGELRNLILGQAPDDGRAVAAEVSS